MTYLFSSFANTALLSQSISCCVFSRLDHCSHALTGLPASLSSILTLSQGDPSEARIPVTGPPLPSTLDLFSLLAGSGPDAAWQPQPKPFFPGALRSLCLLLCSCQGAVATVNNTALEGTGNIPDAKYRAHGEYLALWGAEASEHNKTSLV